MGSWTKRFADGSLLHGEDKDVAQGLASWSKSRLDQMVGTELSHDGYSIEIYGPGEYWQSDTYESVFLGSGVELTQRRIERKITSLDYGFVALLSTPKATRLYSKSGAWFLNAGKWKVVEIIPSMVGKWMVLEYDVRKKVARYFISETRL